MLRWSYTALIVLAFAGVPGLAALAGTDVQLAGSEWRPVEMSGAPAPKEPEMFVRFGGEGRVEGFGGCNRFFGTYRRDGARIDIGRVGATRMACPAPVMDRELRFFSLLERAATFERRRIDLSLYDENGAIVMTLRQTDAD